MKHLHYKLLLFLFALLAVSFFNYNHLQTSTLLSYFLFVILSFSFLLFVALWYVFIGNKAPFAVHPILFTAFLWFGYIVVRSSFAGIPAINEWAVYIACLLVVVVGISIYLQSADIRVVYILFVFVGLVQVVIVFIQFVGIIGSFSTFFRATGTVINPNITALYLVSARKLCIFQKIRVLS